jgi:hypothetical protein
LFVPPLTTRSSRSAGRHHDHPATAATAQLLVARPPR